MNRRKAGTFLFTPSVMMVIVSFVSLINVASAELDKSLSHRGKCWCTGLLIISRSLYVTIIK